MNIRRLLFGFMFFNCLANVGCVMFDGADDFPQPCYGPDCQGGHLLQRGNAQYNHNGEYMGEPVFTPTAAVLQGGQPLPPGVTEIQERPEPTTIKKPDTSVETPMPPDSVTPPVPTTPAPAPAPAPTTPASPPVPIAPAPATIPTPEF